jgi:hypothetical protein
MRVFAEIEEVELENDHGWMIPSVHAHCNRYGLTTESFGTSDASIRRCLVLLREGCLNGERNFYAREVEDELSIEQCLDRISPARPSW